MPLLTCFAFMALFYGICIYGLLCDGGLLRIKKLYFDFRFSEKIALRIAIIFILGFVFYWAKQDRFVYFWDYALYWTASINRMKYIFSHSFSESFYSLLSSINTQDYNDVLPSVVALPLKVFGYTHTKYVFLNFLLFFIPTVLVQGLIGVKLISNSVCRPALAYVLTTFAAAFFQANYYAGLHSFIDIGYLLPLSVAMYLFVDYDFNRISIPKNIAISLCLILSWISRRYVVYFIFGFVVAMVVKAISALVVPRNRGGGGGY